MKTVLDPAPLPPYDGTQPCLQFGLATFFPEPGGHPSIYQQAKAVCFSCPFRAACLAHALSLNLPGVWGGTTENDRREIRAALGVRPSQVTPADQEMVRDRIDELDDGTRSSKEIALALGCSAKTIDRRREARRTEVA